MVPNFDNRCTNLLLLYMKQALTISFFYVWLRDAVNNNSVNIALGDFNINGFNENIRFSKILSQYDQFANTSTNISGSLL